MPDPLGDSWDIRGPTKRLAQLGRLESGEFSLLTPTGGYAWVSSSLAVELWGDEVLDMAVGESKAVSLVAWVEKKGK